MYTLEPGRSLLILIVASRMLVSCAAPAVVLNQPSPAFTASAPASPVAAAVPRTPTPTATTAPTPTDTATPALGVCSPFPGYRKADLLAAISNPYNPPPPGSDDPHQAVDLAVIQSGMAVTGSPVQAALAGVVALIVEDRFPYGHAVMIETPLSELRLQLAAGLPTPGPTLPPHPALTCPALEPPVDVSSGQRSLYLLYAHLESTPAFALGEGIACGQDLGRVGQSGNALNPHLHLEVRVGPAGARFAGMAHYEPRAREAEMAAYCAWRVGGLFQAVDPWFVLGDLP